MVKKIFNITVILLLAYVIHSFYVSNGTNRGPFLHKYYQSHAISELGANNVVSSIVVSYRGLDTLGEVTILFLAALFMTLMIKLKDREFKKESFKPASEILETATKFLVPFIFVLGFYIIVNGHLTPGGGFQGGAVIATGLILLLVTSDKFSVRTSVLKYIESMSGIFYVLLALAGLVWGLAVLDPKILPIGRVGRVFSAGLIPVIYTLIGMKVGSELSAIFYSVKKED